MDSETMTLVTRLAKRFSVLIYPNVLANYATTNTKTGSTLLLSVVLCGLLTHQTVSAEPVVSELRTRKDQIAYLNLEYARVGGHAVLMDLYVPTNTKRKPHVVLFFHGGSWMKGSNTTCHVQWLTQHGYAVASIGYRLSTIAHFPAQIHDGKGAVRFLRANANKYGIDGGNIGASGALAGGLLALLLATSGDVKELEGNVGGNLDQSSRVQAGLGLFCPTDLHHDVVENNCARTIDNNKKID